MVRDLNGEQVMRTCWMVFAVVVSGCTGDSRCDSGDGEYPREGHCLAVDVLGGDSGGFDALALFTSTKDPTRDRPVITPGLIAAGRSAPSVFEVNVRDWPFLTFRFAEGAVEFSHEEWRLFDPWASTVAAVALRDEVIVGANVASAERKVNGADHRYLNGVIELSATTEAELWGRGGSPTQRHSCIRIVSEAGTTYFVRGLDRDCDGIENQDDCTPEVYCDPDQGACPCP
jgi:hypothetical protein